MSETVYILAFVLLVLAALVFATSDLYSPVNHVYKTAYAPMGGVQGGIQGGFGYGGRQNEIFALIYLIVFISLLRNIFPNSGGTDGEGEEFVPDERAGSLRSAFGQRTVMCDC